MPDCRHESGQFQWDSLHSTDSQPARKFFAIHTETARLRPLSRHPVSEEQPAMQPQQGACQTQDCLNLYFLDIFHLSGFLTSITKC